MHGFDGLRVDRLTVGLQGREIVRDVSFVVGASEAYGLVGESGSGKSMTCRAILGLLPAGAVTSGQILVGSTSLLELPSRRMRKLRGSAVGMVFQDPMAALNPVLRVGQAIAQVIRSHGRVTRAEARASAIAAMQRVGIRDAERRSRNYPHQFSGGMRQRIVIAMALAARPRLLLADEPTTALDVIVQAGILRLLDGLRRDEAMSLLLVSHDLSIVAGMCERVGVMYAGELVEEGPTSEVLSRPRHPYTKALIDSHPEDRASGRLRSIPGSPPEPGQLPAGCAFSPRCDLATAECRALRIEFSQIDVGHRSRCIRSEMLVPVETRGPARDD
jgi:oligopeptide/dipeptide ABC transporter ATP-binding protein